MKSSACERRLPLNRRPHSPTNATQANGAGQPTSHASRFCGHARSLPKYLVPAYTQDSSTNGVKMSRTYTTR